MGVVLDFAAAKRTRCVKSLQQLRKTYMHEANLLAESYKLKSDVTEYIKKVEASLDRLQAAIREHEAELASSSAEVEPCVLIGQK